MLARRPDDLQVQSRAVTDAVDLSQALERRADDLGE
jgi:hypothetical protein